MGSLANRYIRYAFIFISMLACLVLQSTPSDAQITRTSRLELIDATKNIHVGAYLYETLDPEKKLTSDIIINRYNNDTRGVQLTHDILNTGKGPSGRWLLLKVENTTQEKNWVISFGDLFDGRTGYITGLYVENKARNEVYINATTKEELRAKFIGNAVPIAVTPGQTEFITMYLEHSPGLISTFVPSMTSYKVWVSSNNKSSPIYVAIGIILLIFSGIFIALSYSAERPTYLFFAGFWLLNALLMSSVNMTLFPHFVMLPQLPFIILSVIVLMGLMATYHFIKVEDDQDSRPLILWLLSGAMVAVTFLINIPVPLLESIQSIAYISVTLMCAIGILGVSMYRDETIGQVQYYYAASWVPYSLGIIFSGLGLAVFSSGNAFIINAYFYALIPQGLLLTFAVLEQVKKDQHIVASNLSKDYRLEEARRKVQEKKDAEDQARLLRVIERERELMASLREQDAQRTQEMRLAKDDADTANAAKSAFLAVVSHEIRTPMNGIMGILKLLQYTPVNEEQGDYVLTMQKTGDTMLALLDDILDFEKMETGRMDLEHINVDLHNMAKGIVSLMQGYVAGKDIELRTEIAESVPRYVLGDPTRLRQVLLNLMSNAIKFTDTGSVTIKLNAKELQNKADDVQGDFDITFSIVDTGPGIDEAAQETLFEPFRQADETVARKYGGSGLGLAISMRLVTAMGSSIRLKSKLGEGSHFFFTLSMEEGYGEDDLPSETAVPLPKAPKPAISKGVMRNILVIEDNEINRKVLQTLLEKDGHNVSLASSGEEGVALLSEKPFDVVFLDINLPGMDGFETTKAIRQLHDSRYVRLPIVAITGNVMSEDLDKIRASTMNDVIGKPIDHEKMRKVLNDLDSLTDIKNIDLNINVDHFELEVEEVAPADDLSEDFDGLREEDYDVTVLQSLLNTLGQDSLTELVDGCLAKADEIVVAMADESDVKELHARMHELKGMAYNFGLQKLGDIARDGEDAAKEGDLKTAQKSLGKLDECRVRTRRDIEAWMES